ncbi:MAG: hypothetical protein IKZ34_03065 [Alphaproteobacteria bacterium]|nr:hypothetical protein [Alphaproteobacteria bacterium]
MKNKKVSKFQRAISKLLNFMKFRSEQDIGDDEIRVVGGAVYKREKNARRPRKVKYNPAKYEVGDDEIRVIGEARTRKSR